MSDYADRLDENGRPFCVRDPKDGRKRNEYKPDWEPREGYYWNCTIFGDWVQTREDTPWCCNPASETYWCS